MRFLTSIAAAALLCALAACGSDDEPAAQAAPTQAAPAPKPAPTLSKADADALRAEIYPLWNAPAAPPCHQPLKIRIDLAEDGRVTRADAKPELAYDDPCRAAQDAAIRAVWAASPLSVPRQRKWSSLILIFDPDALL
jgi:hypothetical protein